MSTQNKERTSENTRTVEMRLEKITPGAARYQEIDADGNRREMQHPDTLIGTLYVRKSGLGVAPPNVIFVTIEPD